MEEEEDIPRTSRPDHHGGGVVERCLADAGEDAGADESDRSIAAADDDDAVRAAAVASLPVEAEAAARGVEAEKRRLRELMRSSRSYTKPRL